jgi:hypothetical protein
MEFHELLENEKFKAAIGPENLAIYLGENGTDSMWDDFNEKSETVLVIKAVHSSGDFFRHWNGFFVWENPELGEIVASEDIESFFGDYPFDGNWGSCETELHSNTLALGTLKRIALKLVPDVGDLIEINGKTYERHNGDLVEV